TRALESERTLSGAVTRRLCAPVLWRALGPPPGVSPGGCSTADGFVRLVAALAAEGPVLIAVDDVEACDRESLRTLAALALQLDAAVLRSYDPPRFAQPLLRPSLHAALPARGRLRIHGEAARVLAADGVPGETVARHLLESAPSGDAWVAERLRHGASTAATR